MAWKPVYGIPGQLEASGVAAVDHYLKFYAAGTTTAISMATDSTGGTTLAKSKLDASGYALNGSSAIFVPHINQKYKIVLYANEADADADTFANAVFNVDGLSIEDHLNTTSYELGSEAAAVSHTGIATGHSIITDYLDSNRTIGSGSFVSYTGTTTAGKAGNWPDTGGFFYDADGKQFTVGSVRNVLEFGMLGDGSTNDHTAGQKAFTGANSGDEVHFPNPATYYRLTDEFTVTTPVLITGEGEYTCQIRQETDGKDIFLITVASVSVRDLYLRGTGAPTDGRVASSMAIEATGTDNGGAAAPTVLTGITVRDCFIYNWKENGIRFVFVDDFDISHNHIETITSSGVILESCTRGQVVNNEVRDIKCETDNSGNGWGITATRTISSDLTRYPACADINIADNYIRLVATWIGIDTHGGKRISITGNTILDTHFGIAAGGSGAGTNGISAPEGITIAGNTLHSNRVGTANSGITFTGSGDPGSIELYATGAITGNHITRYGDEDIATSAAISVQTTRGVVISGNTIVDPSPIGISMRDSNFGFSIVGNVIRDAWTDAGSSASAIRVNENAADAEGYIGGNSFVNTGSGIGTIILSRGISLENQTSDVFIGSNHSDAPTYLIDTGDHSLRGSMTSVSTSGTGEDTLMTTTVKADSVGLGRGVRVLAAGTKTASNGNKTIKFHFGSTSVTFNAAANDINDWRFEGFIQLVSAGAQRMSWVGFNGATVLQGYDTAAEDETTNTTLKVTGECENGSDTVTQTMMVLERY